MGGYGSGRHCGRPTSEATASYIINMARFTRAGLKPGILGRATIQFEDGDFPVEVTVDTRDVADAHFLLTHGTREWGDEDRVTYRINLATTRPQYGGLRWWFVCPRTGRRTPKLFLPYGGRYFRSRRAYGLGYASQRETRLDRLMRKARKLHRLAGGGPDDYWEVPPLKPKWMRWRTYERRCQAWENAASRADFEFCRRAARFVGWL
jgi:hypothetical protein